MVSYQPTDLLLYTAVFCCVPRPRLRSSGDVLSLWLLRRVSAFVAQLKGLLPLVEDGGSLRSLLEEVRARGHGVFGFTDRTDEVKKRD